MEYTPRRKLTREFKLEAVRQVALSEKPKAQLARELGVRVGQLRTWRLEFEKEAVTGIAKPDRTPSVASRDLRRIVARWLGCFGACGRRTGNSLKRRSMPRLRASTVPTSSPFPFNPIVTAMAILLVTQPTKVWNAG
jgi:transposase-like protein